MRHNNNRQRIFSSPIVQAAMMTSRFARELNLAPGNLWEPGIARHIAGDLRADTDWAAVERDWRVRLDLEHQEVQS